MTIARDLSTAVLLLALAGCAGPTQSAGSGSVTVTSAVTSRSAVVTMAVTPSVGCRRALQMAAAEPDPARADPLIRASLDACRTADEWLAALSEYPIAMGLSGAADIDDRELKAACYGGEHRAVCMDAKATGRL
jgi:hypothetical protein